jgi:hypothetical protein
MNYLPEPTTAQYKVGFGAAGYLNEGLNKVSHARFGTTIMSMTI